MQYITASKASFHHLYSWGSTSWSAGCGVGLCAQTALKKPPAWVLAMHTTVSCPFTGAIKSEDAANSLFLLIWCALLAGSEDSWKDAALFKRARSTPMLKILFPRRCIPTPEPIRPFLFWGCTSSLCTGTWCLSASPCRCRAHSIWSQVCSFFASSALLSLSTKGPISCSASALIVAMAQLLSADETSCKADDCRVRDKKCNSNDRNCLPLKLLYTSQQGLAIVECGLANEIKAQPAWLILASDTQACTYLHTRILKVHSYILTFMIASNIKMNQHKCKNHLRKN